MSADLVIRLMDAGEWDVVRQIRTEVFIVEQACPPEEEWDGLDETSRHLLGWLGNNAVAVARWRPLEHDGMLMAKLERFAVRKPYRRRGFARKMVTATIADAQSAGFKEYLIHAQAHLSDYYAQMGFEPFGEAFIEAGIVHIAMRRFAG